MAAIHSGHNIERNLFIACSLAEHEPRDRVQREPYTIAMISQDGKIAGIFDTSHTVGPAVVPVGRMSYVTTLSARYRSSCAPRAIH